MKQIRIIKSKTSDEVKDALHGIISQLEDYNYAISTNPQATRILGMRIPNFYKKEDIIKINYGMIVIDPQYEVKKPNEYSIKIEKKE